MQTVGLSVILGADFSSAEEAMAKFRQSVNNLASETSKAFANMAGTAANIGNAFKPVSDGAKNATQVVINESKARVQADNEETQAALNASKLKIQALREQQAAQRAATQAKKAEKDLYAQEVAKQNEIVRAYYNAAIALRKYGEASGFTAQQIEEMAIKAREGQEMLKQIEAGAGRFQRNVGNYSGATQYLSQSIAQLSGEIPNFFQSMKIGFMSLSNNIQPILFAMEALRKENADLAAQGKATIPIWQQMAKSFLGWQTFLFIGVGLLSKYGAELIDVATGAKAAREATEAQTKRQEELNEAFKSGADAASKQIVEVKTLAAQMTSSNTPLSRKKDLYNQIIAQYPNLIEGTGSWQNKIKQLATTVNNDLIPALRRQAIMQGYAAQAAKLGQELAERGANSNILKTRMEAANAAVNLSNGGRTNFKSPLFKAAVEADKAYYDNEKAVKSLNRELDALINNQIAEANALIGGATDTNTYKKSVQNLIAAEQAKLDKMKPGTAEFEKQREVVKKAKEQLDAWSVSTKQAKTHIDTLTKAEGNLNAEFAITEAKLKNNIISAFDAVKEKISAVSQHMDKLFKNGGTQAAIQKDIQLLRQLTYELNALKGIDLNSAKGFQYGGSAEKEFHQYMEHIEKVKADQVKLYNQLGIQDPQDAIKRRDAVSKLESAGIDPSKYVDFRKPVKEQAEEADKAMKDLQNKFNKFANGIGSSLSRPIEDMTQAIFDGKNAMDALGASVKNLVADLVKAVAKAGLLSLIGNKDQVKSAGGFGGILGSLLGISLKGAIPFLADGGIVTGPTLAMIGESGPEKVQPLNKLDQYSGGNLNVRITGKASGRDLEYVSDNFNNWRDY